MFLLKNELCDAGEYGYLKWHDGWNDEFMDQYQQSQTCQKCPMGKHANYIEFRDLSTGAGCGEEASLSQAECGNAAFEFGYYDIHEITSGRPDLSMSLAECQAYHDNNGFNSWEVNSNTDRPKGCYRMGVHIRWSHTGTLDCGQGGDNCLEKRPKTPRHETDTHAPHGCFMDNGILWYFDNGLYIERKDTDNHLTPYYFCYEGSTKKESCEECTVGKFSTTVGAASASTCETCEAGKFADQTGAVTCKDCPIGFRSARNFEYYTTTSGVTSLHYLTQQECEDFANQINKPYALSRSGTEPEGCYQRFYNGDTGPIKYNYNNYYVCGSNCRTASAAFPIVKKQPIHDPPTSHNCTYCASNRYSLAEGTSACIDCPTNRVVEYPMFISITTQSSLSWDQANEFMVSKEDCLEADAQFEAMGLGGSYGAGNAMDRMEFSSNAYPYGCTYFTNNVDPSVNRVVFNTNPNGPEFRDLGSQYNNRICMVGVDVEKSYVVLESEELRCDDIELCTYQYYPSSGGSSSTCYCNSLDYGGLDGRYAYGNPSRYTGGEATSNGVATSAHDCRNICKQQPECTLLTVTKDECREAKDTLGLDGSNGDQFELPAGAVRTVVPSGCSHYTDPGSMSYTRVQWNPDSTGQDNVKDTLNSACTSNTAFSGWCYRSYNRRVCKKHDKLKKRFKILESTSQKCSDILRLPTNAELYNSDVKMPGLDRWVPTRNNMSYAFNYKDWYEDEKDYVQIGDTPHTTYASHVQNFNFPVWDSETQPYKALVLLPVPCDGCAAGKYSTVGESTCKDCPMGKTNAANMYSCLNCLEGQFSASGEDKCTICSSSEVSLVFEYNSGESDGSVVMSECEEMGRWGGTTQTSDRPKVLY